MLVVQYILIGLSNGGTSRHVPYSGIEESRSKVRLERPGLVADKSSLPAFEEITYYNILGEIAN